MNLYVYENKTLKEVARILHLSEGGIYDRLIRLGIPTLRHKKMNFNNIRKDIIIPKISDKLAEFIGIMLGDGNITPTQVTVTLGTKEDAYVNYVVKLMSGLFGVRARVTVGKRGDKTVYIGSTVLVKWLLKMGLCLNKVKTQVDIPKWCFRKKEYMKRVIRGLIDTDGSIYKLGNRQLQISFTNRSLPLLQSVILISTKLGFHPSEASVYKVYLARKFDIIKYYNEIKFSNQKHILRTKRFIGEINENRQTI